MFSSSCESRCRPISISGKMRISIWLSSTKLELAYKNDTTLVQSYSKSSVNTLMSISSSTWDVEANSHPIIIFSNPTKYPKFLNFIQNSHHSAAPTAIIFNPSFQSIENGVSHCHEIKLSFLFLQQENHHHHLHYP